jgi:hypothetical protein
MEKKTKTKLDARPLIKWMKERERIRLKKEAGLPFPWTKDPILQTYRFCNVFREMDSVTMWINANIRVPYANHPHLWFMLCIARTINWPETLECLLGTNAWPDHPRFSPDNLAKRLNARKDSGQKVYTGAYMIRAESDPNQPWYDWTKQEYIAKIVLGNLWKDRKALGHYWGGPHPSRNSSCSLRDSWETIRAYYGWGPFMAYEVVTDMRHTRYLRSAPDIMSWANAGPGALRGLNRLTGRPLTASVPDACELMSLLLERVSADEYWDGYRHPLEMRDIEHSLCETDKYLRVLEGSGRPRALYVPGRGH